MSSRNVSQFSMIDVNRVFLAGRLTRDPELRYTSGGTAVVTLRLACNRRFRGRNGEDRDEVLYIDVVAWGKTAENCAQYLSKGRPVFVEGRLQSRSWEKDGQKRTTVEVVADRVQFMDYQAGEEAWSGGAGRAGAEHDEGPPPPGDDDIPF